MNALHATNPRAWLTAYFHSRTDIHDVLRTLLHYEHWWLPLPLAQSHYGRIGGETLQFSPQQELPSDQLWLFTDPEAARYAQEQGVQLGTYTSGMRGVEIFEYLPPGLTTVHVNPVSPAEMTWTFPESSFSLLQAWCMAVRFEEDVHSWRGQVDLTRIRNYPQFQIFIYPNQTVLTMPEQFGMTNPAVVCSSPDSTRDILRRVPVEMQNQLQMVVTSGAELMDKLPEQNMDGWIMNPVGPGPSLPYRFGTL
jgi:hypothetical protein